MTAKAPAPPATPRETPGEIRPPAADLQADPSAAQSLPRSAADPLAENLAATLAATLTAGPHRMTVGLRPLAPARWIEDGADYDDQLRERAHLLQTRADVLAGQPGCEAATQELLTLLIAHLRAHLPDHYRFSDDGARVTINATGECLDLRAGDALAHAARLVPDDLCLLQADASNQYRLRAAALCFPTRWRLADKLGEPLLAIHAPVPGYAEHIGAATDRVLAALDVERALWRHNWSLLDSPQLYQPERIALEQPLRAGELADRLWFRSERQTLRRLPQSAAVLFTIRVRQCTLGALCEDATAARRLHEQIRTLPRELLAYKGLAHIEPMLLDYLHHASGGSIER